MRYNANVSLCLSKDFTSFTWKAQSTLQRNKTSSLPCHPRIWILTPPSPETNEAEGITHGLHQQQRELLCLSLTQFALRRCINAVHETRKHAVMHNSIQFLSICINLSCLKCLKTQYNSMIISSDSCIAALGRFSVLLETWEWDSASSPPQRFTWKKSQSALGKARDGWR